MTDFFFQHPERAWFLLAPVVVLVLGLLAQARKRRARAQFALTEEHPVLLEDARPAFVRRRLGLEVLGLLLLALAALDPAYGFKLAKVGKRGVDVVICFDSSRSMLAQDLPPNRLARAKKDIQAFLKELSGDRVALVAFAGDARIVCPLTHDLSAFEGLLKDVDITATRVGGTDIAASLRKAIALLPAGKESSQVIVVLTDGEDLEGKGKVEAEHARARGIRIHAIGYGSTKGARVPGNAKDSYVKDAKGQYVLSRLDAQGLRSLTASAGGTYLAASEFAQPLTELFRKRIRPMQQQNFEAQQRRIPRSRFQWFLIPAFLLLFLAFTLPERRRR